MREEKKKKMEWMNILTFFFFFFLFAHFFFSFVISISLIFSYSFFLFLKVEHIYFIFFILFDFFHYFHEILKKKKNYHRWRIATLALPLKSWVISMSKKNSDSVMDNMKTIRKNMEKMVLILIFFFFWKFEKKKNILLIQFWNFFSLSFSTSWTRQNPSLAIDFRTIWR